MRLYPSDDELRSLIAELRASLADAQAAQGALQSVMDRIDGQASPVEGRIAQITVEEARAYIAKVRWTFARTMPQHPHWYTLREQRPELRAEFFAFVSLIRRAGVVKPWPRDAKKPRYNFHYLTIDGWEYWTMGAPIPITILINRAQVDGSEQQHLPGVPKPR